jgi:hypothetical protein
MNKPPPFHEPVEVEIAGMRRALVLTPEAYRRAQKALGGRDPREALAAGGLEPLCIIGACARHYDQPKTSDKTVEGWVTRDPKATPALVEAVGECVLRFLETTGLIDRTHGDTPGGDEAP